MFLDRRDISPELMDDPALAAAEHRAALRALARVNRVSGVARALWTFLAAEAPASVFEIGSGGGDVAIDLARRARRAGVELAIRGSDLSLRAVEHAREASERAKTPVEFETLDALASPIPENDIIICTLMLHHFSDDDACRLLAAMGRAARRLVLVCDLDRSLTGFALAWAGTRLLSRSRVSQVDGGRSVRAAFRPEEALAIACAAGFPSPRIKRLWPSRWLLVSSTRAWMPSPRLPDTGSH